MSFMALPFYHSSDDDPCSSSGSSEYSGVSSVASSHLKPYQQLPQNQLPAECAVCRSPSIEYHYNVPSCSGCKTFFRRTIVNGRRFICTLSGNCLDVESSIEEKRMCRGCRFEKCVNVGMDPSAIRAAVKNSEGTYLLNEVIEKQRRNRGIHKNIGTKEDELSKMIQKLSIAEEMAEKLHKEPIPLEFDDRRNLSDILQEQPVFDSRKIRNLTPSKSVRTKHTCQSFMHSGLLATIELSKTYDYSSRMDVSSRVVLLKHVALIGSIMQGSAFSMHHKKSDILLFPDGSITGKDLKPVFWSSYGQQIQKTLHAFLNNKVDRVEYIMLKAIILSNPAVSGLSEYDQMVIESERNLFGKVLLDYCILKSGVTNGPARFGALLSIIPIIELQAKNQKDFYILMKATTRNKGCANPPRVMFDEVMDP